MGHDAQVSTKVVRIDFKEIIDNSLDRNYWKKIWNIFEYDGYRITLSLSDIQVEYDNISLKVKCTSESMNDYELMYMRLPMGQYNEEVFRNKLLSSAHWTVRTLERTLAEEDPQFALMKQIQTDKVNAHIDQLKAHLDDLGITDEGVREVYIGSEVDDFSEVIDQFVALKQNNILKHVHNMIDAMVKFVDHDED